MRFLLFFLLFLSAAGSADDLSLVGTPLRAQQMVYDFNHPKLVGQLTPELNEVSGLSPVHGRPGELLAVQDELGKIFRIDTRTGAVLWAAFFWKDGDYEGIEAVGEDIWVVKNTGTLYQVKNAGQPDQAVEKYNTELNGENDVEGLAYDARQHRLLLACKQDAKDDGNDKNGRYIFAFDLQTMTLSEQPAFAIEREAVERFLASCEKTPRHEKLCSFFVQREAFDLSPSAIAVHPRTGELFITSSVGKVLMVLSPGGQITQLYKLDKDFFPQPEGLAFADDGTLFISTERRKDAPARVWKISWKAR